MSTGKLPDSHDGDGLEAKFDAVQRDTDIGQKQMRASLRSKLFGAPADPVRLGRFVVVRRLGQGGMGVVYSAYDPDLDRRVAIKLLRRGIGSGDQQATERLKREAQALARLSHPNVVAVHEVGVVDGQVFIVMEFIVGTTLRDWVREEGRTWGEILEAYLQAGEGLRAAHEVGLVHRDFKPENALRGDDGRARVLDFGLARSSGDSEASDEPAPLIDEPMDDSRATVDPEAPTPKLPRRHSTDRRALTLRQAGTAPGASRASTDPSTNSSTDSSDSHSHRLLDAPLTMTGAILGTPAYMSPEQFERRPAGPASDQFSFCVSLFESLYGQRAFAGETLAELRDNVCAGNVRPPPDHNKIPRRLSPILQRGLRSDAHDRYPSMADLLAALAHDPARRRRRWLVAAVVLLSVATALYSLGRSPGSGSGVTDPCHGAADELSQTWNPERSEQLSQALLAIDQPYARPASMRVRAGLDEYARQWVDAHENACRAHQRGEQSGTMLDRRMACLAERRDALDHAVAVLTEIDASFLERAVDVVHALPAVGYCSNLEALAAEIPPPEDPVVAAQVESVRGGIARVSALESAGRYSASDELLAELASTANAIDYPPLRAEIALLWGRIDIQLGRAELAIERLRDGTSAGLASGANLVALEAWARYLYALGTSSEYRGDALASLFAAEALCARVPNSTFVHALLLNNAGVVSLAASERARAIDYFERALKVRNVSPRSTDSELTAISFNLAMVTTDPLRREQLMRQASEELESALGAVHPRTLESRMVQGYYTNDLVSARALLDSTCADYTTYHPKHRPQITDCNYYLSLLYAELGDPSRAAELAQSAAQNPHKVWLGSIARAYAALYRDDPSAAITAAESALPRLRQDARHWWNKKHLAAAHLVLGRSHIALGRIPEALPALERAHELFAEVVGMNDIVSTQLRLARTRMALATAIWPKDGAPTPTDSERARAQELVTQAARYYRTTGQAAHHYRRAIDRWHTDRGLTSDPGEGASERSPLK